MLRLKPIAPLALPRLATRDCKLAGFKISKVRWSSATQIKPVNFLTYSVKSSDCWTLSFKHESLDKVKQLTRGWPYLFCHRWCHRSFLYRVCSYHLLHLLVYSPMEIPNLYKRWKISWNSLFGQNSINSLINMNLRRLTLLCKSVYDRGRTHSEKRKPLKKVMLNRTSLYWHSRCRPCHKEVTRAWRHFTCCTGICGCDTWGQMLGTEVRYQGCPFWCYSARKEANWRGRHTQEDWNSAFWGG